MLAVVFLSIPIRTDAAQTVDLYYTDFSYEKVTAADGTKGLKITKYYDRAGHSVRIPSKLNDDPIVEIGENAFSLCLNLEAVIVPNTVQVIGNGAFQNCANLSKVTLPDVVIKIGTKAFDGTPITDVLIPSDPEASGKPVYLGKHLIGVNEDYKGSFTVAEGTLDIAPEAFMNCTGVTAVTIPSSVSYIGAKAFLNTPKIATVTVKNGNKNYSSSGNCLVDLAANKMLKGTPTTRIPENVTSFDANPFSGVADLSRVTSDNERYSPVGHGVVQVSNKNLLFGDASASIPKDGVTAIGTYAFSNQTGMKKIVIPDTVTSIASYAFQNCTALEEVQFSKQLTSISTYAFNGCSSLKEAVLPDTLKTIGNYTFSECSSLEKVKFSPAMTTISARAFENCKALKQIEIPSNIVTISGYAFNGCSALQSISFHEAKSKVTANGGAFNGCSAVSALYFSGSRSNFKSKVTINSSSNGVTYTMWNKGNCITFDERDNGDLNGDGFVTDADAIYLLFHTFWAKNYPIPAGADADYNNDGKVTDADAIHLLFFNFFPNEYSIV